MVTSEETASGGAAEATPDGASSMTMVVRISAVLTAALLLVQSSAFAAVDLPADAPETTEQAIETDAATEPVVSPEWAGPPLDRAALDWHPSSDPAFAAKAHRLSIPRLNETPEAAWSRTENADGSTAVSVKRSLTNGWNSKVGADMTLAPQPEPLSGPINPSALLPGAGTDPSAGAAWATLVTPAGDAPPGLEGAALGARLDTSQSQRKLGVSASKSLSLGEQVSLTLQGGYAATDLTAVAAVPDPANAIHGGRIYSAEQVARVAILPTHTTIAAGRTLSSADERWLHSVTAEQTLFEGVSVAGTVAETAGGPPTTSLVAKFQRRW